MTLPALNLVSNAVAEVKRDVRRLRWFRRAFLEQVASVSQETHITFDVDTSRLAEAFLNWSDDFEKQKPAADCDKRRYVDFAAGLMLCHLIQSAPLKARQGGVHAPDAAPSAFWPEGYSYLASCLNIRDAVLRQNYGECAAPSDAVDDLRSWWSFRENVVEDPRLAIPFLEYFAGVRPEWGQPDNFRARLDVRHGAQSPGKLRLVHDSDLQEASGGPGAAVRPTLAPAVSRVLLDLEVLSNQPDIYVAELTGHLQGYGVSIDAAETRARFRNAPIRLAMTHAALVTGQICPSRFIEAFEERLAARYAAELRPSPALRSVLRELSDALIETAVVSSKEPVESAALVERLSLAKPALPLRLIGSETLADDLGKAAGACDLATCVLVSNDPDKIAAAQGLGMTTVGFVARPEQRGALEAVCKGDIVDHFLGFPRPAG